FRSGRVRENVHAKGGGQFGDGLPYSAKADDAHGEPIQFDQWALPVAPIETARPMGAADALGVMADVLGQFEEQREGGLSNGFGAVSRDICDRDRALPGG